MVESQSQVKDVTKEEELPNVLVKNLRTYFFTSRGIVKAIDNLSFKIRPGETYGLVGESGSGKSVTATSIIDLIPDPPGRVLHGEVYIEDFNVYSDLERLARIEVKSETNVKIRRRKGAIRRHNRIISRIRGKRISMIFQEPFLSLNPVLSIGDQLTEPILLHNAYELTESIVRRETISLKDVTDFAEEILQQPDYQEKGNILNRFVERYALYEVKKQIKETSDNLQDQDQLSDELLKICTKAKKNVPVDKFTVLRDYYKIQDALDSKLLDLITYEAERNDRKVYETEEVIKNLRGQLRSDFLTLYIKSIFFKRNRNKEMNDLARRKALEMLDLVNIASPEVILNSYPHELSGGMLQRVMIAMALSSAPTVLIADEPTTALDVTTQAQILNLIKEVINKKKGQSVLFITHDLAVIAEMCDRVGVMYGGNLVEEAPLNGLFKDAKHPYTTGLMNSIPRHDRRVEKAARLESIPGTVPDLINPPTGCRFHPRCKFRMGVCSEKKPKLVEIEPDHKVACFLYSEEVEEDINDIMGEEEVEYDN